MKRNDWVLASIFTVAGLLVLIFPQTWVKIIVAVMGLGAAANGIYNLVALRNFYDNSSYKTTFLIKNISSIVFGLLAAFVPLAVAATAWKVLVYIFAVYLLIAAAIGFYSVALLKNSGIDRKRFIFENLFILIAGVLLFLISPVKLGTFIVRIIGLVSLLLGLVIFAIQIFTTVSKKKTVVEVEVTSEEVKDEK